MPGGGRYFGYDERCPTEASPFDLPDEGLVCMVFNVGSEAVAECHELSRNTFMIGDWAVSTGAHEETVVHGPFGTLNDAFEFSRRRVGAVRFFAEPEIDFE